MKVLAKVYAELLWIKYHICGTKKHVMKQPEDFVGEKKSETEGFGLVELVAQKPAQADNINSFNSGLDNLLGNGSIMDSKRKGVNVLCTHVGGVQWTTEKN